MAGTRRLRFSGVSLSIAILIGVVSPGRGQTNLSYTVVGHSASWDDTVWEKLHDGRWDTPDGVILAKGPHAYVILDLGEPKTVHACDVRTQPTRPPEFRGHATVFRTFALYGSNSFEESGRWVSLGRWRVPYEWFGPADRPQERFRFPNTTVRYLKFIFEDPEEPAADYLYVNEVSVFHGHPQIVTTQLDDALAGHPYADTLCAIGLGPSIRWQLLSPLPPGLKLCSETGVIKGIGPTSIGGMGSAREYTFRVRARDSDTTVEADISLRVVLPIVGVAVGHTKTEKSIPDSLRTDYATVWFGTFDLCKNKFKEVGHMVFDAAPATPSYSDWSQSFQVLSGERLYDVSPGPGGLLPIRPIASDLFLGQDFLFPVVTSAPGTPLTLVSAFGLSDNPSLYVVNRATGEVERFPKAWGDLLAVLFPPSQSDKNKFGFLAFERGLMPIRLRQGWLESAGDVLLRRGRKQPPIWGAAVSDSFVVIKSPISARKDNISVYRWFGRNVLILEGPVAEWEFTSTSHVFTDPFRQGSFYVSSSDSNAAYKLYRLDCESLSLEPVITSGISGIWYVLPLDSSHLVLSTGTDLEKKLTFGVLTDKYFSTIFEKPLLGDPRRVAAGIVSPKKVSFGLEVLPGKPGQQVDVLATVSTLVQIRSGLFRIRYDTSWVEFHGRYTSRVPLFWDQAASAPGNLLFRFVNPSEGKQKGRPDDVIGTISFDVKQTALCNVPLRFYVDNCQAVSVESVPLAIEKSNGITRLGLPGRGDLDRDGTLTLNDVGLLLDVVCGKIPDAGATRIVADFNRDDSVNVKDAWDLYWYIGRRENSLDKSNIRLRRAEEDTLILLAAAPKPIVAAQIAVEFGRQDISVLGVAVDMGKPVWSRWASPRNGVVKCAFLAPANMGGDVESFRLLLRGSALAESKTKTVHAEGVVVEEGYPLVAMKVVEGGRSGKPTASNGWERFRVNVTPNPFNESTVLTVLAPNENGAGTLKIFDVRGRVVRTFYLKKPDRGQIRIRWDGRDASGIPVPSGMYLCRVLWGEKHSLGKLLLLR